MFGSRKWLRRGGPSPSTLRYRTRELADRLAHCLGGIDHGEVAGIRYHLRLGLRHARRDRVHPWRRHARLQRHAVELVVDVGRLQHQDRNRELLERVARLGKVPADDIDEQLLAQRRIDVLRAGNDALAYGRIAAWDEHVVEETLGERIYPGTRRLLCAVHGGLRITAQDAAVDEDEPDHVGARLYVGFGDHPASHAVADQDLAAGPNAVLHLIDGGCHAGD